MEIVLVCLVAFAGSALTLYSGFGLGTVLLPAMALLFPAETAVAATAVVHLSNNLFKAGLVGKSAHWSTVLRFGLPAVLGAIIGALLLGALGSGGPVFSLEAFGRTLAPTGAALVIGLLLIVFAALELQPWFQQLGFPVRFIPIGGVFTGFFGGLSGQQGALRSAFLLKSGLGAQQFIATGVMIAILIDLARLPTYAVSLSGSPQLAEPEAVLRIAAAMLSAFAGAWLGARYFQKATIGSVRIVVAAVMIAIGAGMATGLVSN
ncbi:MAG: TSUP family transporter [Amphiplicatus sp.]